MAEQLYLYANLKLKYGKLGEFTETMIKLRPLFEDRGWRLVGAWSTIVGDLNEVHDIWEISDANHVPSALSSAFADPEFMAIAPELADQIDREVTSIVVKTGFSG